jgi:peptidyl-dipeptidase Dcp
MTNPLLQDWQTPFGLPPFASFAPDQFAPAFKAAMADHLAEIEAIAQQTVAPDFLNTITALERSGRKLEQVSGVFWNLTGSDSTPELQEIERAIGPALSRHFSEISSNAPLFQRVDVLHEKRHALGLSTEQLRVLEQSHRNFVRSGARLDETGKARLTEITARLAELGIAFSQNVLADETSYELVLEADDLDGLPDFVRAAARQAAIERGKPEKHLITLSRSLIEPFLTFSTRRDLREQAYRAWTKRGETGGPTDNRVIIRETLALRAERARLLGFADFASFKLAPEMAKVPAAVDALLGRVWEPAKLRFAEEKADLEALAREEGFNDAITAWDWRFYAEKVRKARHSLDEAEIKPYLQLENVIQASFAVATRLFGLQFLERSDLAAYHPDARCHEVKDAGGNHVGLFIGDYFNRSTKRSGAWMSAFREQHRLGASSGTETVRPIIVNVMNFAKPAEGQPALLSFDDARTLFHEFGHGLHGLLSDVTYPSIAGTSVARDFVELPSQLYEHWLQTPAILSEFALHAETGAAMPAELIGRIIAAANFNQGFGTVEYTSSALIDMAFHALAEAPDDPVAFEAAELKRIGMPDGIGMRHRSPHFSHVFSGDGYSAGYYSYLWSEVLDADAFEAFEATGNVFDPALAARLKQHVYAAGGSRDPAELYRAFRGADPDPAALLRKRGLAASSH